MSAAAVGQAANSSYAEKAAQELANGNLGAAASNFAAAWDVFGIGNGVYSLFDGYQNQAARNAFKQAQQEKSQRINDSIAAQIASLPEPNSNQQIATVTINGSTSYFVLPLGTSIGQGGGNSGSNGHEVKIVKGLKVVGILTTIPADTQFSYNSVTLTAANKPTYEQLFAQQRANFKPEDFLLSEQETAAIIEPLLNQLLQDTNANHKELLNALWKLGALTKDNTQTSVLPNSTTNNTFLSAPYTPAGTSQAQQTKIVVAPDGTTTVSTVPRPDLAANTSQAPTRQEVGTQANTQTERPVKEGSTAEAPDICAKNPNSLMCMEMGNADYEDVVIPEKKIDLDISPANIFNTNAICPPPVQFNVLNQTYDFEYTPMCNFAEGIRPIMILIGIIAALSMCYSAVKEL